MFERYTEDARRALFFARYEVSQIGDTVIDTEHLLLGVLRESVGIPGRLFARAGMQHDDVRREIVARDGPRESFPTSVEIPFSVQAKCVLQLIAEEADALGHRDISTEHFLLGILREANCLAAKLLVERGVDYNAVRQEIISGSEG